MKKVIISMLCILSVSSQAFAQKPVSGTYLMTEQKTVKGEKVNFTTPLYLTIVDKDKTMMFWDYSSSDGDMEGFFRIELDSIGTTNKPTEFKKIDENSFNKKWYNDKYTNMPMNTWIVEKNERHEPSEFMKGIKKVFGECLLLQLVGKIEKNDIPKITPTEEWKYLLLGDNDVYSISSRNAIDNEYQTYTIKEVPCAYSSKTMVFIIDHKIYNFDAAGAGLFQLTTVHDGVPVTLIYKEIDTPKYLIDAFNKL